MKAAVDVPQQPTENGAGKNLQTARPVERSGGRGEDADDDDARDHNFHQADRRQKKRRMTENAGIDSFTHGKSPSSSVAFHFQRKCSDCSSLRRGKSMS